MTIASEPPSPLEGIDDWDPMAPAHIADPLGGLDHLRRTWPVAHSTQFGGFWSVARHRDVVALARDHDRFISSPTFSIPKLDIGIPWVPAQSDPPAHRHYRRIINPFFFASRLESFVPTIEATAHQLIDEFEEVDEVDLVEVFNRRLPALALCLLLGLPPDDSAVLDRWTRELVRCGAVGDIDGIVALYSEMVAYGRSWMEARRSDPGDDVMSALVTAEIDGRGLTDDEVIGTFLTLVNAGHNTVTNTLGLAQAHLAEHPEDWNRLAAEPALMPSAIEEFIRYAGAVQGLARTAVEDVEVGGRLIRAGEPVVLLFAAASRDEDVFDRADQCLIDRTPNPHVSFGAGVHKCVGEHLARLELRVGLGALIQRLAGIRIVGDVVPALWPTIGVYSLPVRLLRR